MIVNHTNLRVVTTEACRYIRSVVDEVAIITILTILSTLGNVYSTIIGYIELNVERAAEWIGNGAQPSETARRILSYKGVLLKHHLQVGVNKGAISQEQADVKFNEWLQAKEAKIANAKSENDNKLRNVKKDRLEAEKKHNETIAAAVAAKRKAAAEAEAAAKAEAEAANAEEAPSAEEAPAAE